MTFKEKAEELMDKIEPAMKKTNGSQAQKAFAKLQRSVNCGSPRRGAQDLSSLSAEMTLSPRRLHNSNVPKPPKELDKLKTLFFEWTSSNSGNMDEFTKAQKVKKTNAKNRSKRP